MDLLNTIVWSVVAFGFVLGVMIFIHELGHYLVAKGLGIKVEVFSLGFGRRLFGFRRNETDYRISILPLGGYVKMAGENYGEDLTGDTDEFLSRPKSHRFAVAVAGPLMNLVLAVLLVTVNFMIGVPVAKYLREPAVIGSVTEGLPGQQVGLLPRDTIVEIDGKPTLTWQDVELQIASSPNQRLLLTIQRGEDLFQKAVDTAVAERFEVGTIGVTPLIPYIVAQVEPGSPAEQAGLEPGDEITTVSSSDKTVHGFNESAQLISSSSGAPLNFVVHRDSQVYEKSISAVRMDERWRIGTVVENVIQVERYGPFEALNQSFIRNYRMTTLTFEVLGKIFTGQTSMRTMSGPIEIARFSGMAAAMGLVPLINFMALISLQLGILNLLPIPILDGGVIALLATEAIIRRDLSTRLKERISQAGFIFLLLLMGIVIFNDLAKNLPILN